MARDQLSVTCDTCAFPYTLPVRDNIKYSHCPVCGHINTKHVKVSEIKKDWLNKKLHSRGD